MSLISYLTLSYIFITLKSSGVDCVHLEISVRRENPTENILKVFQFYLCAPLFKAALSKGCWKRVPEGGRETPSPDPLPAAAVGPPELLPDPRRLLACPLTWARGRPYRKPHSDRRPARTRPSPITFAGTFPGSRVPEASLLASESLLRAWQGNKGKEPVLEGGREQSFAEHLLSAWQSPRRYLDFLFLLFSTVVPASHSRPTPRSPAQLSCLLSSASWPQPVFVRKAHGLSRDGGASRPRTPWQGCG